MAQGLAHLLREQGVVRSNRIAPTIYSQRSRILGMRRQQRKTPRAYLWVFKKLKNIMLCAFCLLSIFLVLNVHALEENDDLEALFESESFYGATGMIESPSASILPFNYWAASIHRFQLKLGYGLLPGLEIGLGSSVDFNQTWQDIVNQGALNSKVQLLRENWVGFDLSAGLDVPKQLPVSYYSVAGWKACQFLGDHILLGGWGTQRFNGFFGSYEWHFYPGVLLMNEYINNHYNAGVRFLLSDQYKLDFLFEKINQFGDVVTPGDLIQNHLWLGLSHSEPL